MVKDVTNRIKIGEYQIGEKIDIDFEKIDYLGKSVRRKIMDNLIEKCMGLPATFLSDCIVRMRFFFDGNCKPKSNLKLAKEFVKGKRHAMPRIIDEKRSWIRQISQLMDNFEYGVIVGIEVFPDQLSDICPSNISYQDTKINLIRYKVMLVGKSKPSNVCEPSSNIFGGGSDGKMNIISIKVNLLDNCFIKIKND